MFARLLILFITIPMIELILFLTLGEWMGLPATIGVVILTGFLGAWLTKKQGLRTLRRYREALAEGRLPHDEVLEGLIDSGGGRGAADARVFDRRGGIFAAGASPCAPASGGGSRDP